MIAIIDKRSNETDSQKSGDVLVVLPDDAPLGKMERAHAVIWDDPDLEAELAALDGLNPKIAYPYAKHEILSAGEDGPDFLVLVCRSSIGLKIDSLTPGRISDMTARSPNATTLAVDQYEIELRAVIGQGDIFLV